MACPTPSPDLGFVLESTTTGKLAGNESFTATGHTLVWTPPQL